MNPMVIGLVALALILLIGMASPAMIVPGGTADGQANMGIVDIGGGYYRLSFDGYTQQSFSTSNGYYEPTASQNGASIVLNGPDTVSNDINPGVAEADWLDVTPTDVQMYLVGSCIGKVPVTFYKMSKETIAAGQYNYKVLIYEKHSVQGCPNEAVTTQGEIIIRDNKYVAPPPNEPPADPTEPITSDNPLSFASLIWQWLVNGFNAIRSLLGI